MSSFALAGVDRFGLRADPSVFPHGVASLIDHTLLKPEATQSDIERLCGEAREYGFATVCVNPTWVKLCATALRGAQARVCTVVGFPLGATLPEVKALEARRVIEERRLRGRHGPERRRLEDRTSSRSSTRTSRPSLRFAGGWERFRRSSSRRRSSPMRKRSRPRSWFGRATRTSSRPRPASLREAPPWPMSPSCAAWWDPRWE